MIYEIIFINYFLPFPTKMPLSSGWWEYNPVLGLYFTQSSMSGMPKKKAVLIKHHNCIFEGPSITLVYGTTEETQ